MLPQRLFIKKNAIYKDKFYSVHLQRKSGAVTKSKLV